MLISYFLQNFNLLAFKLFKRKPWWGLIIFLQKGSIKTYSPSKIAVFQPITNKTLISPNL